MIIYKITNIIDNKCYIGQTINAFKKRLCQHLCRVKNNFKHPLYDSIRKYGWNNFSVEIIDKVENINDLNKKEIHWINTYNSVYPNGYNLTEGGCNGIRSEKTKLKLSMANKGKKKPSRTKEHCLNLSLAKKGQKMSEENRLKMQNRAVSQETKLKISLARKGMIPWNKGKIGISEETRNKMSLARKGKITWMKGKHHTIESKIKNSLAHKNKTVSLATREKLRLAAKKDWIRRKLNKCQNKKEGI